MRTPIKLLLTFLLFFLLFPLKAWAYFDPGFGGYLVNSIISVVVTGFAFVSAAVIYFFRVIIGKRLLFLWQNHKKLCHTVLLSVLGLGFLAAWGIILLSTLGVKGRFFLEQFLHRLFSFHSTGLEIIPYYLIERAFIDPVFDKYLSIFFILLTILGIACLATIFMGQKFRKFCFLTFLSTLILGGIFLSLLFHAYNNPSNPASHGSGARVFDFQDMSDGYNLSQGVLTDENGRTVKEWPGFSLGILDKNGDLYGQQNTQEPLWGRYTWDNKTIWEKHFLVHHEIYLSPKGTIFTFTKDTHDYNNNKVDFDIILEYDKSGQELQRFSFWDHLKDFQPFHNKFTIDAAFPILLLWTNPFKSHELPPYDYFHLNSFSIIPPNNLEGKNPAFRRGNWLISLLHGSMVFILDQDTKKILWHMKANDIEGSLQGQHSASMLPDGNILLFENGVNRRASRVLIIDPLTLGIKWQYTDKNFFSESAGYAQALPNGNFLVTDSEDGHSFELTPDKKIVWDYYYPANIFPMIRYPKEMIDHLLKGGAP